ncbi:SDR family oxidoreductase, partial [Rhodococcus sp. CX]|uniref:SDR family NAD(P)-dependent oxidoreductase n=2 Tax=unclassified Rhodococcus (in: high G+C Gram-positive bacteria) TaxID=192944 RepID=UPI0018CFC538
TGEAAAESMRGAGHDALFHPVDVTSSADWAAAADAVRSRFGRIDGLVNNAGIPSNGDVLGTTDEEWARTVSINQTGMFLGMRTIAPVIKESGGGSIVNVASTLGFFASRVGFAYQATKGAVRMMTKSAALALAPDGIRVNTVLPGLVDTPFLDGLRRVGGLADSVARTPVGRLADPREISQGVVFLLSDESSYMTGSELVIDGGLTAGSAGSLQPTTTTGDAS